MKYNWYIIKISAKVSIRTYEDGEKTLDEIKSSLNIDDIKLFEMEVNGLIKQVGGLFFKSTPGSEKVVEV